MCTVLAKFFGTPNEEEKKNAHAVITTVHRCALLGSEG